MGVGTEREQTTDSSSARARGSSAITRGSSMLAHSDLAQRTLSPAQSVLEEVGDLVILTGRTMVKAVLPPYPYGEELVSQFLFVLRLCWLPLLLSTIAISYGAPGLEAENFLTIDRRPGPARRLLRGVRHPRNRAL